MDYTDNNHGVIWSCTGNNMVNSLFLKAPVSLFISPESVIVCYGIQWRRT